MATLVTAGTLPAAGPLALLGDRDLLGELLVEGDRGRDDPVRHARPLDVVAKPLECFPALRQHVDSPEGVLPLSKLCRSQMPLARVPFDGKLENRLIR